MTDKYYDTASDNSAEAANASASSSNSSSAAPRNMPHTASPGVDLPLNAAGEPILLVDRPAEHVVRLTLNRPEKRNSLIHPLRGAIISTLVDADQDENTRVAIIRGAGQSFSAGYDLGDGNAGHDMPFYTPKGEGEWPRHVTETWMSIWDLSIPVIAQVHGYCLAGGSELATGCDLVYMAEDAKMGYPATRFGVPDMHFHPWLVGMRKAMEMMLTGDSISGVEAAARGWATAAYPAEELEQQVLEIAQRIATVHPQLLQLNKRIVHRQMEYMGMRSGIRAGTELCALGIHTDAMDEFVRAIKDKGVSGALKDRDKPFGDYRLAESQAESR